MSDSPDFETPKVSPPTEMDAKISEINEIRLRLADQKKTTAEWEEKVRASAMKIEEHEKKLTEMRGHHTSLMERVTQGHKEMEETTSIEKKALEDLKRMEEDVEKTKKEEIQKREAMKNKQFMEELIEFAGKMKAKGMKTSSMFDAITLFDPDAKPPVKAPEEVHEVPEEEEEKVRETKRLKVVVPTSSSEEEEDTSDDDVYRHHRKATEVVKHNESVLMVAVDAANYKETMDQMRELNRKACIHTGRSYMGRSFSDSLVAEIPKKMVKVMVDRDLVEPSPKYIKACSICHEPIPKGVKRVKMCDVHSAHVMCYGIVYVYMMQNVPTNTCASSYTGVGGGCKYNKHV